MVRSFKKISFRKRVHTRPKFATRNRSMANPRTGGDMGMELKFLDTTFAQAAIATTVAGGEIDPASSVLTISAPAQGDGESSRDGRKVVIKTIRVRGNVISDVLADQTAGKLGAVVKIALVLDTQSNGAQLNAEDVFAVGNHNELWFRNLRFERRFKVLAIQTIEVGWNPAFDGTNLEMNGETKHWKMDFNVNTPVTFTATTGVVASVSDNSYHLIAVSSQADTSIEYDARVRFVG